MSVRTSMATLITDLRFKVGDPIVTGTPPTSVFTDDELQAAAQVLGEQALPFDLGGGGADGGVGPYDVHADQRPAGDPAGDPGAAA